MSERNTYESQTHSNALENRLTRSEIRTEQYGEKIAAHDKRLSLLEKAILGIAAVLQVILQDKYPALAAILKSLLP